MSHIDKNQPKIMGRRELLKALAATSGAVTAASMLPGKWSKPVIEAGVLPAHAQGSQYTLTARIVNQEGGVTSNGTVRGDYLQVEVQVTPAVAANINDEFTDGSFSGGVGPKTTDGTTGIANFVYNLCEYYDDLLTGDAGAQVQCDQDQPFEITYTFADQSTYGTASDSVSASVDVCNCFDQPQPD